MKKFAKVTEWLGWPRWWDGWDRLCAWAERTARASWRAIVGWLLDARPPIPHCVERKPVSLESEALETRFCMSTVGFSSSTYAVDEYAGTATITVTLDSTPPGTVTVDYATVTGGSATSGTDYTTATGTLTFLVSDPLSKSFTVTIANDLVYEGDETVSL